MAHTTRKLYPGDGIKIHSADNIPPKITEAVKANAEYHLQHPSFDGTIRDSYNVVMDVVYGRFPMDGRFNEHQAAISKLMEMVEALGVPTQAYNRAKASEQHKAAVAAHRAKLALDPNSAETLAYNEAMVKLGLPTV